MSVTFSIQDTEYKETLEEYEGVSFMVYEPIAPFFEINVSNLNARPLLVMLGCNYDHRDLAGVIAKEDFAKIVERLKRKKVDGTLLALVRKTETPSPNCIVFGIDEAYLQEKAEAFLRMIELATKLNKDIHYA